MRDITAEVRPSRRYRTGRRLPNTNVHFSGDNPRAERVVAALLGELRAKNVSVHGALAAWAGRGRVARAVVAQRENASCASPRDAFRSPFGSGTLVHASCRNAAHQLWAAEPTSVAGRPRRSRTSGRGRPARSLRLDGDRLGLDRAVGERVANLHRDPLCFGPAYSGMLPCLRLGPGSFLVSSISIAVQIRWRVSHGSITSSR